MRKYFCFLCFLLFVISFYGCEAEPVQTDRGTSSHPINFELTSEAPQPSAPVQQPENQSGQSTEISETYRINQANVYSSDEVCAQYGFRVGGLSIYQGKSLPDGVKRDDFKYFEADRTDESGNLTGETSYLFLTFEVKNESGQTLLFTWNAMLVFATDSDGYLLSGRKLSSWETRYRSGRQGKENEKDYYVESMEPEESVSITTGYIIDDSYINSKQLYFSPFSALTGDGFHKMAVYQIN